MGRKSASKSQARQTASGSVPPSPPPSRSFPPLLIVALVLAIAAGVTIYFRGVRVPDQASQNAGAAIAQTPVDPPPAAKLGPHPQENLPPLPFSPEPPARPAEVARAAYRFAAEHPEVLAYVPCYCGCERSGHRGNDDCFVTRRDEKGDVVEWEPHGMT
jgi:Protein of unknown function with PCYCGC motif